MSATGYNEMDMQGTKTNRDCILRFHTVTKIVSMACSCKEPIVTRNSSGRDSIIWPAMTNLIMLALQIFTLNTNDLVSHNVLNNSHTQYIFRVCVCVYI